MATWTEIGYYENAKGLSSSTPLAVDDDTADKGVEDAASHYNHVHILASGAIGTTAFFADNIVDGTALDDDAVNAAELATLSGNVDFNDNEAKNMVIHKVATTPPATALGKVFMDTDATPPTLYVCTAV